MWPKDPKAYLTFEIILFVKIQMKVVLFLVSDLVYIMLNNVSILSKAFCQWGHEDLVKGQTVLFCLLRPEVHFLFPSCHSSCFAHSQFSSVVVWDNSLRYQLFSSGGHIHPTAQDQPVILLLPFSIVPLRFRVISRRHQQALFIFISTHTVICSNKHCFFVNKVCTKLFCAWLPAMW